MTNEETRIDQLIRHLVDKTINDTELKELAVWRDSSASHQAFVAGRTATLLVDKMTLDAEDYDAEGAYNRFVARIAGRRRQLWRTIGRIAIVVMLVCIPAAVMLFPQSASLNRMEATAGHPISFDLPDGSHVTLAAGSTLTWDDDFGSDHRQVQLDGEAYFDVVHDGTQVFRVKTPSALITDVGTQFRVCDTPTLDVAEVHVVEGIVDLTLDGQQKPTTLRAGLSCRYDKVSHHLVTSEIEADAETMRSLDHLIFDEAPLSLVAERLSLVYGQSVDVAPAYRDRRVNGVFDVTHDTLSQILRALAATQHATVDCKDGAYTIH